MAAPGLLFSPCLPLATDTFSACVQFDRYPRILMAMRSHPAAADGIFFFVMGIILVVCLSVSLCVRVAIPFILWTPVFTFGYSSTCVVFYFHAHMTVLAGGVFFVGWVVAGVRNKGALLLPLLPLLLWNICVHMHFVAAISAVWYHVMVLASLGVFVWAGYYFPLFEIFGSSSRTNDTASAAGSYSLSACRSLPFLL